VGPRAGLGKLKKKNLSLSQKSGHDSSTAQPWDIHQTEWGIPINLSKIYAAVRGVRVITVLGFGAGADVTSDCI
jgi:hypothetical protein